jgi:hypothetical protein
MHLVDLVFVQLKKRERAGRKKGSALIAGAVDGLGEHLGVSPK